jgi:hypothetical protein
MLLGRLVGSELAIHVLPLGREERAEGGRGFGVGRLGVGCDRQLPID